MCSKGLEGVLHGSESVQHSGGCAVNSVCGEFRECAETLESVQ